MSVRFSRRALLASAAAGAALTAAGPAAAQFDLLGAIGNIAVGAGSLFEGLALGEPDELAMGEQLYPRMIELSGGLYPNAQAQQALQRFAQPLLATTKRQAFRWEIALLDDDTVNAWCLPGGKIGVNKGLLRYAATPDELAAVIAHEIGHAELSHALAEMRTAKFTQGIGTIGKEVVRQKARGAGGALANEAITHLEGPLYATITSGYSRSNEEEADRHILTVFAQTGHDCGHACDFFRTLLQIVAADAPGTTSLFNTHPGTRERIAILDQAARAVPPPAAPAAGVGFADLKHTFPTRAHFRRNV